MKDDKNILKWLNNELSEDELTNFKKTEDYKKLQKIAHYSSQIHVPKVDVSNALKDLKERKESKLKKGKIITFNIKKFLRYAAFVTLLLTSSYFLFKTNDIIYKTNLAQTKSFYLPDTSEVILNANSTISFSKKEWKENRILELDGEAFFKVKKGKKFTVHTTTGKITVLGTQFNVKKRKNYFEVKTYEGLVSVTYKDTLLKLPKGTVFKVINTIINDKSTFNVNEKSWLQKESNFKSIPLKFVLEEIENQFGYTIDSKNVNLDKLYSGGFTHSNIDMAMQSIAIPLQLSYKIRDKKITLFNYAE